MAAKVFFLLALIAIVASAENDCNCDPPAELEDTALWEFLRKLSTVVDKTDPQEDKDLSAVLPGELSPLLECNCLEKNRRKRRIMPETAEEIKENGSTEASENESAEVNEEALKQRLRTPKCPRGTVWVGIRCIEEKYTLDK